MISSNASDIATASGAVLAAMAADGYSALSLDDVQAIYTFYVLGANNGSFDSNSQTAALDYLNKWKDGGFTPDEYGEFLFYLYGANSSGAVPDSMVFTPKVTPAPVKHYTPSETAGDSVSGTENAADVSSPSGGIASGVMARLKGFAEKISSMLGVSPEVAMLILLAALAFMVYYFRKDLGKALGIT